ncbi:MAG: hypothetical protein RRB13_06345 [bacterium]|nr:hypothetical protein [bacterium]
MSWPPDWLSQLYCRWAHRINRIAAFLAFTALAVMIGGLAWAIWVAPAAVP